MIADFLGDHFEQIVNYSFTADVEQEFDQIATGALARNAMLEKFYTPFHKLIENSGGIDRSQVAQATPVGTDPKSGKMIYARLGRFGPMLQLGDTEGEEKPQFAPIPKGARVDTVTLEQALKAFQLPRLVGETPEGLPMKANIGRFGPYIQVDNPETKTKLFISIKPLDPHTVTHEEALELYAAKLKSEAEKNMPILVMVLKCSMVATALTLPMAKRMPKFLKIPILKQLPTNKPNNSLPKLQKLRVVLPVVKQPKNNPQSTMVQ